MSDYSIYNREPVEGYLANAQGEVEKVKGLRCYYDEKTPNNSVFVPTVGTVAFDEIKATRQEAVADAILKGKKAIEYHMAAIEVIQLNLHRLIT